MFKKSLLITLLLALLMPCSMKAQVSKDCTISAGYTCGFEGPNTGGD